MIFGAAGALALALAVAGWMYWKPVRSELLPVDVDVGNGVKMRFVWVPPGSFWMGDHETSRQQEVLMPLGFHIGAYEVTQRQWQEVMGSNPSWFSRGGGGMNTIKDIPDADLDDFPVKGVSWNDAQDFIKRLNQKEAGRGFIYRLPTGEEWEYACRGGPSSKDDCAFRYYVDRPTNLLSSTQANFDGSRPDGEGPPGPYLDRTCKVGRYPPNKLGIHDMHGNVHEWTTEILEGSTQRALRGGVWYSRAYGCHVARRDFAFPESAIGHLGFRLVRVPADEP